MPAQGLDRCMTIFARGFHVYGSYIHGACGNTHGACGNRVLLDVEGNVQEFFEKVVEGPRHTHVEGSKESPAGLCDLMQRCWDEKLDNRPDASECYKKLTQLYQKFGAPSP